MARNVNLLAPPEILPGPSSPGSVTAEIGGERGALIVHVPAEWAGREIEIRPVGAPWNGTHVAVMTRHLGSGDDHSAFFPSLGHGTYEVRPIHPHGPHAHEPVSAQTRSACVTAGEVADIDW